MAHSNELFTLIVPVLNEEEALPTTHARLCEVLDGLDMPYEVIVIDNGSTDRTPGIAASFCNADPRWKYLRLSRNFGYQNSITAAMLAASGDAIMIIDADLQDPPELIPQFIARWREGYDIVYGVREKRTGESFIRVQLTMLAMRLITWMNDDVKTPRHCADFRLISRRVRDAFAQLPEANRYVRGLIHWLGFQQIGIPYTRLGRTTGVSKANPLYLIGFTLNAIFTTSIKPLRFFSLMGLGVLTLTAMLFLWTMVAPWFDQTGLAATNLLLLLNLGMMTLGAGVLGEYLARIHAEARRRPLYFIDYSLNLEPGTGREATRAHAGANGAGISSAGFLLRSDRGRGERPSALPKARERAMEELSP